MRAVGVTKFGSCDELRTLELSKPQAGPGELRIRVRAAAVNPADTVIRSGGAKSGRSAASSPPWVPGMDAAGVLDEIGEGVPPRLHVGDDVMAIVLPAGHHGAYAEYVVVPAESVAKTPAGTSYAEAASLPMNGLTARRALDTLGLSPGDRLAITGAAGTLGGYAIQLARAEGIWVIADASAADEVLVRSSGADLVLARGDDIAQRIRDVVPEGVDALLDAAVLDEKSLPAVRDGGQVATFRGYQPKVVRNIRFHRIWVHDYARETAKLEELRRQVEDGTLTLRVACVFDADQAAQAHRQLEAGGTRGRIILAF